MEMVQAAGRVNISSEDEIKMTENTTTNEALEKIGSLGFDSRDRRKSKYLSYPYTNMGPRHKGSPAETEDVGTPILSPKPETSSITTAPLNGCPSSAKLGSKRFRTNWHRKFISRSTIASRPEFVNASSDELLSGLRSKAVDCMFPMENKRFESVEWFFCRYRISKYHDEAELATFVVNVKGGNIRKAGANDFESIQTDKKRRKNNKIENKVKPKMKPLSGLSDMNLSSSTGGSSGPGNKLKQKRKAEEVTSLPTGSDSPRPAKKLKPRRKVEEVTSLSQLQNGEITFNQSGGGYSAIPETTQSLIFRNKVEAAPEYRRPEMSSVNTDAESTKCSSLVIDLQLMSQSIPCGILQRCNGGNKKEPVLKDLNPELCVSQEGFVGKITNLGLSVNTTSEVVDTVSANEAWMKGKMERVAAEGHLSTKLSTAIPDLNGTVSESNSISKEFENVSFLSPVMKSEHPRSLSACVRPFESINSSRVEDSGEAVGNCLLLRFAPGVHLPSKEDLMAMFFHFGPLKVSETRLLKDTGSAQLAFVRSVDATEAFRSLELNKPFGAALVDCKLRHLSAACPPAEQSVTPIQATRPTPMATTIQLTRPTPMATPIQPTRPTPMATPIQPTTPLPMAGEAHPPLNVIRQNLQMMTSMLQNSGNNLSPEMRAKLDSELKNLMKKVNSSGCSSMKSDH